MVLTTGELNLAGNDDQTTGRSVTKRQWDGGGFEVSHLGEVLCAWLKATSDYAWSLLDTSKRVSAP